VCPFRIFIQPYSKAHARPGVVPIRTTSSASTPPVSRMLHTNFFYEKALFVKPTWRLFSVAECNGFRMPFARYVLLSALSVSLASSAARCIGCEIRLSSGY
jgi:hypothetical protein